MRERPMVVITVRLPRRSRMSQACPGGRPREVDEPVSISTVTGGMAGHLYLEGLEREDAAAGLLGCGQDREGPLRVGRASSYEVTPSKFERVRGRPANRSRASMDAAAD